MFDLSWGEIALVGVVALIVIGPKELPGVLRGVGQALAKLRRMASDFQYQFNQALQEAEVDKVKSSINSVTESMQAATPSFNPIDYAREQIKSAVDDVKAVTQPNGDVIGPPAPSAAAADPVAAAIPAPPTYTADPQAIQSAFSAPPVDAPFPSATPAVAEAAAPADAAPAIAEPAAETPAEPVPAKPKRARKTAAAPAADEAPAAASEPAAEPAADEAPEKPKRARKTKA